MTDIAQQIFDCLPPVHPAVANPINEFETSLNDWYELQQKLAMVDNALKGLRNIERDQRCEIAESLRTWFGEKLKEGMNNYKLSNGRKLKYTNKVDRKVDSELVSAAERAFSEANDAPTSVFFDDIVKIRHEVSVSALRKVEVDTTAFRALAKAITSKIATPTIEVD